jgi:hypothetical protein
MTWRSEPDVVNIDGWFYLPIRSWELLLALARQYGWQPAGTVPACEFLSLHEASSSDDYLQSRCQVVLGPDALALATALERALPDIPTEDVLDKKAVPEDPARPYTSPGCLGREVAPGMVVTPLEEFSGENKETIVDFIEHCRQEDHLEIWPA